MSAGNRSPRVRSVGCPSPRRASAIPTSSSIRRSRSSSARSSSVGRHEDTFAKSVEQRPPDDEFVFYDGPPFANGLPHYGHLLTGFVKDAVPRYRTMRGQRVERRFGWDCHGLPVEMQAEQELGLSGRVAIEAYGVDKFNERCRSIVGTTADVWRDYVTRQARWVDMDHDYKTMDLSYMESVMWAQKQLYDKGLLYEGYRVLPYCWECETPLSNFETRLDDAYRDRQDPAVTVLVRARRRPPPARVDDDAVDPAVEPRHRRRPRHRLRRLRGGRPAVRHRRGHAPRRTNASSANATRGRRPSRAPSSSATTTRRCSTSSPITPNAFVVLGGDFVTTEDGTGVVHMAPGFGEDDQRACEAAGIAVVAPVDEQGRFTGEVSPTTPASRCSTPTPPSSAT